jgi:prepilin-type N-terminal cleavage/methylation domain-containing protein
MSEAGYTLTETLAAMAVIGLAMGSLSLGAQLIGGGQLRINQTASSLQSSRLIQTRLEALLAAGAPFGSQQPDRLSGDARSLRFACGAAEPCTAALTATGPDSQLTITPGATGSAPWSLLVPGAAHFVYRSTRGAGSIWPPADPARQSLGAVLLVRSSVTTDIPVISAKVWAEEPAACDFDPVALGCR